jgi:hypothetical protein
VRRELEAVNRSMADAFNRGDRFAAARQYADDARILGPGGERVVGRAASHPRPVGPRKVERAAFGASGAPGRRPPALAPGPAERI